MNGFLFIRQIPNPLPFYDKKSSALFYGVLTIMMGFMELFQLRVLKLNIPHVSRTRSVSVSSLVASKSNVTT